MINLVFLGPPGSGKGTQASIICKQFDLDLISIGDILRSEQDSGTSLGEQINKLISKGNLVPLDIIIDILSRKVQSANKANRGILFDGVPRNFEQVTALNDILESLNTQLHIVVVFRVDCDTVTKRLKTRYICNSCDAILSVQDEDEKTCAMCSSNAIEKRDDDICDQAIEKRLNIFEEEADQIINFYKEKGILVEIDACKKQEQVTEEILRKLRAIVL